MSLKKRIISNIAKLSVVDVYSLTASFLSSYFNARFLGPILMGTLQTATLALSYAPLASFSLPFILRRDLPQLKGEGKEEEALFISTIVFTYGLVASIFSAIVVFIISFYVYDKTLSYILVFYSIIISIQGFSSFGNIIVKGLNKYDLLAKISLIAPTLRVASIIGVYYFQLHAILITLLLISLIEGIIYYIKVPYGYRFKWHTATLKRLMIAALPLFFVHASSMIFDTIDRFVIAAFGTFEQVGYYSVGNFISNPLNIIVGTTSLVLFTQLNEKYGKDTSPEVIKKQIDIPISIISKFAPVFLLIGAILIPYLVNLFLPKYKEGIGAAQIIIIGIYFYGSSSFASNALFLLNKQKWTAIIFFIVGTLKTLLAIFMMKMGFGIEGVALSTTLSYLIYNTILVLLVYYAIDELKPGSIKLFNYLFPLAWAIIAFYTVSFLGDVYLNDLDSYLILSLKLIQALIIMLPVVFLLIKEIRKILN